VYGKVGQRALILAVAAWKGWNTPTGRPYWSLGGQMHYTLVTLVSVPVLRATVFDQPLAELGEQGRERKRGPDGPLAG